VSVEHDLSFAIWVAVFRNGKVFALFNALIP
jgi:hypothetical protein